MRILFDLWLHNPERTKAMSEKEQEMFQVLWNFVYDQIYILDNELEQEEQNNDKCFVCIELLNKRISFNRYSDELIKKLIACFPEDVGKALEKKIEDAVFHLN